MRPASAVFGLVLAASLGEAGCIPYRLQETPRVTGTVLNAVDHKPVSNARLHYLSFPKKVVIASTDGAVDFPAIYRWQLVSFWDRFYYLHLVTEVPGYRSEEFKFQVGGLDLTNQTICLRPE